MVYQLNIHKIEQSCLFELTWGQGRHISAILPYPAQLTLLYQTWRRAYISYYRQALRGRVAATGQLASTQVDWHSQVSQAEARLLSEFHKWLRHEALFDLRAELMKGETPINANRQSGSSSEPTGRMELFLTCSSLELARLPWETWQVGADLGQQEPIQIIRSPAIIRSMTTARPPSRRGKTRVLAILGDEQGLNFEGDRAALNAQKQRLDIHYVGWQPDDDILALKERICQAIADPKGWDVLFFAGHSNESALLDGQVAIAPNTAISIRELTPYLTQAQKYGLQFAFFNSCSGLDIASGLINLGLSQVAIMREPIHNDVAHSFLFHFLQRLAQFDDVQAALAGACRFLKLEKNLTYPSAYLVPSLFRHPESVPFRIEVTGWRGVWRQWRPTNREAIAITALVLLSLINPLQDWLLNQRLGVQARYRDWTGQIPTVAPSVLLVQIDDRTLQNRQIAVPNPIDRDLLADLLSSLTNLRARTISIDYLLDRPQPAADAGLRQVVERAVDQQTWIVWAAKQSHLGEWLSVASSVASPNWSLQGDIWSPEWHIRPRGWSDRRPLPLSYWTAMTYQLAHTNDSATVPVPQLDSSEPLQAEVASYLEALGPNQAPLPRRAILHPVTNLSYLLRQRWLQPLVDFSLPPDRVYHRVSAWDLLEAPAQTLQVLKLSSLQDIAVIVAPGGYDEAGFTQIGEDNLPRPIALGYWHRRSEGANSLRGFTGGELHAYMTHHLLRNHLIVPIPDVWMILLAALVGKGVTILGAHSRQAQIIHGVLVGGTAVYGLVSLQLYISGAVLLPWLLPSLTIWLYSTQQLQETRYVQQTKIQG